MSKPIYIFSGNQRQADDYVRQHNLKPSEYRYISSANVLRGTRGGTYIKAGTPWSHYQSHLINSMLLDRGHKSMNDIYPKYWFCKRGESDIDWILTRMAVIPNELKQDVADEYERIFRRNKNGRELANKYLHNEAIKYRVKG